jgi:small-conductance mechanosensitive channel
MTTIRTYQGEEVLIPNATIFTNPLQVVTGFGKRRTDLVSSQ